MGKVGKLVGWCLMLVLLLGSSRASLEKQIDQIDQQIEQLEEMKRGYESRALRAENQATRLQFQDQYVLETRRYWEIAEENRAIAEKIQEEIDRLQIEKQNLQSQL
jgi:hypothetical protein